MDSIEVSLENGIVDNLNSLIVIYPNPAQDYLTLESTDMYINSRYELMNLQGAIMKNGVIQSDKEIINISDYSAGIYFVKIFSRNGNAIYKFVIAKD